MAIGTDAQPACACPLPAPRVRRRPAPRRAIARTYATWRTLAVAAVTIAAACLLGHATSGRAEASERRVLAIGSTFQTEAGPVAAPRANATAVAAAFAAIPGFAPAETRIDPTAATVADTIAEFRATSHRADLAIIYLSGQAVHDDRGLTHLLAPDARSLNEALLLDDLVSSSRTEPTAALTLVILDASFSNDRVAALARERNLQPGIAALAPRAGIIVLSAHERYDALDIEEPDGRTAFTEALLEALEAVAGRTEGASLGTLWEEVAHRAADRHDLLVPEFFGDAANLETALFGVPEPPVASDDAFIKRIQARLKETGCYVSVVDGVWGRGSNRAFAQFQAALATAAGTGPRRPIGPEWRDQVAAQRFDAALADRIEEVPPRPRLCEPPRRVTTTATGRNTARPAANGGSSGAAQRPTERPAARKEPSRPRAPDNFGTGLF